MLTCQRHLFSLPEDLRYLNCASRAPLLKSAEALGRDGLEWQRAPRTLAPGEYHGFGETLRARFGALVNAPADAVAVVPAASYGVAIAARNLPLGPGANIVLPDGEFPSGVYAWMARCAETGAELRLVAPPDTPGEPPGRPGDPSGWSARLLEAIDADTAAVNVSTVHWASGYRFDVAAIGARAREVGALLILDGTQSIGAEPFDFQALAPDLLVCSGYKWLLGPYQTGLAVFGERLIGAAPLENHWATRAGSEDMRDTGYSAQYRDGARRFDGGQHANQITLPMLSEGIRQLLEWGVAAVGAYCAGLRGPLAALLESGRVSAFPESERCGHITGLKPRRQAAIPALMNALAGRNIRVSQRGAYIRVSPHVYNTVDDMAALADTLAEALK